MTAPALHALVVDALAQEIRRVDGGHKLGAGALAEALMPFLRSLAGGGAGGGCPYCRLAESAHPQPAQVDEWRPTYGREPEGWRDHRLMFLCWEDGTIEASECYGTIAWDETTHWVPAKKPTKPALTGAAKHE